jgi:uncharacterized tellurite resistance protein B-like protein
MLELTNEQEAFMAVIYACMSADNDVSTQEYNEMMHIISKKQLYNGADIRSIFVKIQSLHHTIGYNSFKLIEMASGKISEKLRLTLYANAIDIFASDKNFHANEQKLAVYLQKTLDIDNRQAKKIQEVITIKNMG